MVITAEYKWTSLHSNTEKTACDVLPFIISFCPSGFAEDVPSSVNAMNRQRKKWKEKEWSWCLLCEDLALHMLSTTPKILMMLLAQKQPFKRKACFCPSSRKLPEKKKKVVEQPGITASLFALNSPPSSNAVNYREMYGPGRFHHFTESPSVATHSDCKLPPPHARFTVVWSQKWDPRLSRIKSEGIPSLLVPNPKPWRAEAAKHAAARPRGHAHSQTLI